MKPIRIIGFAVLALIWIWLVWAILAGNKLTLINLFWIAASAIIIFVPLWRKYGPSGTADNESSGKKDGKNAPRRK